jgi:Ser-tRNA(Ala) deacylase AlaX
LSVKFDYNLPMSQLYHLEPYKKEILTTIKSYFAEDGSHYIQLEDNIFHPHGGGQKGDRGVLVLDGEEIAIFNTIKDKYSTDNALLVPEKELTDAIIGKQVLAKIDWDFRYRQMRLHDAVHLHHCVMADIADKELSHPKVSNIEDGFAFNRYEDENVTAELVSRVNVFFIEKIAEGGKVTMSKDENRPGFYWWEVLGYKLPCGGTHLADIHEIGDIDIQYSVKKRQPTITFRLK